jgi:hypothetical protein
MKNGVTSTKLATLTVTLIGARPASTSAEVNENWARAEQAPAQFFI